MIDDRELIWVDKDFAEQHKEMFNASNKRDEQIKVFNEYIAGMKDDATREFKAQLESLEEDAMMYAGLMLKVKKAFETAKNEQLTASYDLWEKFEKEIPYAKDKIDKITKTVEPLSRKIAELNTQLTKISTFDIERISETIRSLANMTGEKKEMVDFLIKNFKK